MPANIRNVDIKGLRFRLVDAKEQVVGRLAAQLAFILQGKDKPTYTPNADNGDVVVVTNARHVDFTGKKWDKKLYRWHSGYPGGLKERTAKDQFARDPTSILYKAVYGMLPKNNLRQLRARKLRIFPDEEHPWRNDSRLVKFEMPPRKLRVKEPLFEIPEGFQPLNPDAYRKRFGHMLPKEVIEQLRMKNFPQQIIPAESE